MTEKLFKRSGDEFTGTPETHEGKIGYWTFEPCNRCGGAGGFNGWPGWTCFRCGNQNPKTFEQHFHRLYTADKLAKANAAAEKREAKKAMKATADETARVERAATFSAQHAELFARAERFPNDSFIADVLAKVRFKGTASDKQIAALAAACDRLEARQAQHAAAQAASQHVGTIGERVEVVVTVSHVASFERQRYMSYGTENVYIVSMTDDAGNVYVSKGANFNEPKGERFTLRATVKAHDEYKGVKQTVVNRAKRTEIK